ncbi:MAG: RNA repair domain-containing protein [Candidatus Verstraetearchaeota archaeon]|nr:RNA repair domain-containing protein [Candidatus Verstraetearchaeota archaeon]
MTTIRDLLNKLKWSGRGGLRGCEITIVHRGAPGNRRVIRGEDVDDVAPRALICIEGGREVVIPYHRVVSLTKDGEIIWSRRGHD